MDIKTCCRCKESKLVDEFYSNKSKRDGLSTECKKCVGDTVREWKSRNTEAARQIQRRWRANNPEKANSGRSGRVERRCEHCFKGFTVQPSHAAARFCSKDCRYKSAKPSIKQGWQEKFCSLVETRSDDECWNWSGYKTASGYGSLQVDGKGQRAHRLAYTMWVGPIPEGMDILHSCDNPPCCNPNHLRAGTHAENMHDMDARNRAAIGERSPGATMTNKQVVSLRAEYERGGISIRELADKHGLKYNPLRNMLSGKTWRKVA